MICKHCGYQIDTRKRKQDGTIQCPKCKVVYRPRPKAKQPEKKNKSFLDMLKSIPWKRKIWKLPLWLWIVVIVIVVGSIGNIIDKNDTRLNTTTSTAANVYQDGETSFTTSPMISTGEHADAPNPEQEDDAETVKDPFEYSALQVFKEDYTVSKHGDGSIYVRFLIDGINVEWTVKAFKNSATNYCKKLSMNFPDAEYTSIHFTGYCSAVDKYGNSSYQDAIRLTIDKSEIDKINWDRFVFGNIDSIGYDYVLGSLLK